jgi:hypothetical protein
VVNFVLSFYFARAVSRELPNNFPFVVKKRLIVTAVDGWSLPSKKLFEITKNELHKRIKEVIEDYFSQYTHGRLKQRVMCVFQCLCRRGSYFPPQRATETLCIATFSEVQM